jgi:hypothetical protein
MAEQYDNNNRFALFKNNKTKETQPDYTGTITLDGKELRLSAWVRTSEKVGSYLSGQLSEKQEGGGAQPKTSFDNMPDEVPF